MKHSPAKFAAALSMLLMLALVLSACTGAVKNGIEQAANDATDAPVNMPTDAPKADPTEVPSPEPTAEPDPTAEPEPEHDPVIATVGTVEFRLSDFLRYYERAGYMVDYEAYIKERLVEDGILLSKAKELGITLSDREQADIETFVDSWIESDLEYVEVDPSITDPDEIRAAKLEILVQFFAESDQYAYTTVEEYRAGLVKYYTDKKLIEKLKNSIGDEIVASPEDIEEYCRSHVVSDRADYESLPGVFANVYNGYIQGRQAVPLYVPADMFTVKDCLISFENASETYSGEVEGYYSPERTAKIDEITARLEEGISLEEFMASFVYNPDFNDDTVFTENDDGETLDTNPLLGLRDHGYIMNEQIYYRCGEGFGAAACVLYYGDDWRIPNSAPSKPATAFHDIEFFTTTDGVRIAKVEQTYYGTYFLYISEVLPEGEVHIDMNDTESEAYRSLRKYALYEERGRHIAETVEAWMAEDIPYSFNDEFLDDYCENTLGPGSGIYPA